jgi:hypothetical protein
MPKYLFLLLALGSLASGCGSARSGGADSFPFNLRGQDTRFRISMDTDQSPPTTQPTRELGDAELCYIVAGDSSIECFTFGSLLILGPGDGIALVEDNPILDLRANDNDSKNTATLRTLGVVALIGASVERLPEALADYIQDPGDNAAVAIAIAEQLVANNQVDLPGYGRGGRFNVAVELTHSGRKRLREALRARPGQSTVPALLRIHASDRTHCDFSLSRSDAPLYHWRRINR